MKFLKKILSLKSRALIMGKNRVKIFLLHFWNQNDSIRTKKEKKIFGLIDPMTSSEWNVPRLRVKDILDVGLTYMVRKVFSRAIF